MPDNTNNTSTEEQKPKLPVRKYFVIAGICVLAAMLIIIFYFIVYRYEGFSVGFIRYRKVFAPIVIGFVLAYLLNPIVRSIETAVYPKLRLRIIRKMVLHRHLSQHRAAPDKDRLEALVLDELEERTMEIPPKKRSQAHKQARNIGIAVAFVALIGIIVLLGRLIIPQMIDSVRSFIRKAPAQVEDLFNWLNSLIKDPKISIAIEDAKQRMSESMMDIGKWAMKLTDNLSNVLQTVSTVYNGVYSAIKVIINIFIGVFIGIYLLSGKETFIGQIKKIVYAAFKPKTANQVLMIARKTNDIFQNYIVGVILDSLVVGIAVYILSLICHIPYAPLIAVIVGVTNIVPVFGPFVGAIPSLFIVLMEDPIKALILLIIIFVVQQADGNVIKPIVFGNSVGLSSFWILFSIIIGGELFGFAGMLLGVPVFAVIYYLADELVTWILQKRGLPLDTRTYIRLKKINLEDNSVNNDEIEIPLRPGERILAEAKLERGETEEKLSLIQKIRAKTKAKKTPFDLDDEDNIKQESRKTAKKE